MSITHQKMSSDGGKSKSHAKRAAAKINAAKAREALARCRAVQAYQRAKEEAK